jgi:hypothetical protein
MELISFSMSSHDNQYVANQRPHSARAMIGVFSRARIARHILFRTSTLTPPTSFKNRLRVRSKAMPLHPTILSHVCLHRHTDVDIEATPSMAYTSAFGRTLSITFSSFFTNSNQVRKATYDVDFSSLYHLAVFLLDSSGACQV